MKKRIFALMLLFGGIAFAHTPVITPAGKKTGDRPPRMEKKPLPPMIVTLPGTPGNVVWLNSDF